MTYPDIDRIAPQYAIVCLPMDGQFRQDVGAELLTDGGFENPLLPNWPAGSGAVVTSVLGARPGGSGTRVMRVTDTGLGWASQVLPSKYLHLRGWTTGIVTAYVGGTSGVLDINTNSTLSWQEFDKVAFVNGNLFLSIIANGYAEFDDFSAIEHPQVTRSLSLVPGALNYARLGDGHTASTMPGQRSGRGLTFNGSQYAGLDWAAGGPLDTQTFTVLSLVQPTTPSADGRIYEVGIAGKRYSLYYDLSAGTLVWEKDDTTGVTITSGYGGSEFGQPFVVAASISSTGMRLMVNDRVMGSVAGDVRLASFDAASKAFFGQDIVGGNRYKGTIFQSAVYGFELNPAQVREWGRRARQMRNR